MTFQYVGKSLPRTDAYAKVTGQAMFTADFQLPRMLYAQVLRAGHAHARILSIDTSAAEACEGVVKVVTGQGCKIRLGACGFQDTPVLADEKVRHMGDPVAVVIADTARHAKAALSKIKVEYEVLPVLLDPEAAAKNKAVLIHERMMDYNVIPCYYRVPDTNIFHHYKLRKGDASSAFAEADEIVEGEFEFPLSEHGAMEPHAIICRWENQQRVEMWATTQAPFELQHVVSEMYHLPMADIRVHVPYMGGGFGGKSDVTIEPMIIHASRQVPGFAVKYVCSRQEVMTGTTLGRGMKGRGRLGAKKDGTFVAFEAEMYFSDGAYGDMATNVVTVAGHNSTGPYAIDNCHVDAYGVYTNTPPVGAYRGYGHPEGQFIGERLVDMMSRKLGVDPGELRRKNFLSEGKKNSLGETIRDYNGNLYKCLDLVEQSLAEQPLPAEDAQYLYGRGIAAMMKSPKGNPNASSCCQIKFHADGSVALNLSGIDMGQGAQQAMRQIAAEALKVDPEKIGVYREVDTQHSPWEWQTVASMFTYRGGNAIVKTAAKVIQILKENAAQVLRVGVDALDYDGKAVFMKTDPDHRIALADLVHGYMHTDGVTVGEVADATAGDRLPRYASPNAETGMGTAGGTWTFGCQGCDLRVNKQTGEITIDRFVSAFDVGRVISPQLIRGQIVGGVAMGVGQTLFEKIEFAEDGKMKNSNWMKYHMPRIDEVPKEQIVHCVETPEIRGPFGARCIAEHPMVAVSPTILNALQKATGHDFRHIPVTPDDVRGVIGAQ